MEARPAAVVTERKCLRSSMGRSLRGNIFEGEVYRAYAFQVVSALAKADFFVPEFAHVIDFKGFSEIGNRCKLLISDILRSTV